MVGRFESQLNPRRDKNIFFFKTIQTGKGALLASCSLSTGILSQNKKRLDVNLTTHVYLL